MFYENSKREDLSTTYESNKDAGPSSVTWNQHPVISTVLWMLGGENKKLPELPPSSSIDNFRPHSSGLDGFLAKQFQEAETRRNSNPPPPTVSAQGSSTISSAPNSNIASRGASNMPSFVEENQTNEVEGDENDDEENERSSSSDGTQLLPNVSRRYGYDTNNNNNQNGTPNQGSYFPAQQYAQDSHHGHNFSPYYGHVGGVASSGEEHPSHQNDGFVDSSPSPQWGFYVAITPPQQEMYSAIKKDLMTIQQQHSTSATQKGAQVR